MSLNVNDFQASYPAATDAVDVPVVLVLEDFNGNMVQFTPGQPSDWTNESTLTLSLSGATVGGIVYFPYSQLIWVPVDKEMDGHAYNGINTYPVDCICYSGPSAAKFSTVTNTTDIDLNYPKSNTSMTAIADVTVDGLITAHMVGQCIVEVGVPFGNSNRLSVGQVKANVIVTVIL